MAQVKIMYWKKIPYGVRAKDDNGQVSRPLPEIFQEAVDSAAMIDGDTSHEAYQAAFTWGPDEDRSGPAAEVADAVVAKIVADYPEERLKKIASRRGGGDSG